MTLDYPLATSRHAAASDRMLANAGELYQQPFIPGWIGAGRGELAMRRLTLVRIIPARPSIVFEAMTTAEFWNPKVRSPNCFNAAAARTELPQLMKRTEWVLAGASKDQMIQRTRAAVADHSFKNPEPGAISFMLSKSGYINDDVSGPWLPHVMFFLPHGQAAAWGAGLERSPVVGSEGSEIESTVLFVPVRRWSDGSPAQAPTEPHTHTK